MILLTLVTILFLILVTRRSRYSSGQVSVSWQNQGGVSGIVSKWILTINVDGETYSSENSSDVGDYDFVHMKVTDLPYKEQYNYNLSYQRFGLSRLVSLQEGTVSNNDMKFFSLEDLNRLIYGPWVQTDKCGNEGKLLEERTVTRGGMLVETEERNSSTDCCYETEWSDPKCETDGKLRQRREAAGNCSDLSTVKTTGDCCYQTAWEGKECIDGTVTQTRETAGACTGEDAYTTRTGSCNANLTSGGQCGSQYGQCVSGCCSIHGWCGGVSYCGSQSQHDYHAPEWTYS